MKKLRDVAYVVVFIVAMIALWQLIFANSVNAEGSGTTAYRVGDSMPSEYRSGNFIGRRSYWNKKDGTFGGSSYVWLSPITGMSHFGTYYIECGENDEKKDIPWSIFDLFSNRTVYLDKDRDTKINAIIPNIQLNIWRTAPECED